MILPAIMTCAILALAGIFLARDHRQMNLVCIIQAAAFVFIAVSYILSGQVPARLLAVGSPYFFVDHLGIYEILISAVIFTCAAIYARGYVDGLLASGELEKGSLRLFYIAWALLLPVLAIAFCADNLALFWIAAELTTIISAMLIAILAARENIDAAIKYIFIASTAMLFSFAGFIFLFEISRSVTGTGSLNWTVLLSEASRFPEGMAMAAFVLVFIGFAAKSGIFPFHTWLPEAHAKAPSAVSAVLSGVLLNIGIYGIIRVYAIVHQTAASSTAALLLLIFGLLTVGIAAFSMFPQKNLKKLVAFSSVENMGFILVGLAVSTPLAMFWVIFHILAHSVTKATLFLSAGILHRQYRSRLSSEAVDDIHDVFRYQPLAAWGIIIGGLVIIGMPPFPVFFSKFFILVGLGALSPALLFIMLVLLFIAAVAFGYFTITVFSRTTAPGQSQDLAPYKTPASMKIPVVVLLVLLVVLGIWFMGGEVSIIQNIITELRFS